MTTLITEQTVQTERDRETKPDTKPALSCEFTVGVWRVLPQLNRIRLNGTDEERQLEPRLIKLLCFLAANEGRVLSREKLAMELWPRVVVNENSLTRAISELRKRLQSQDPLALNHIETIPKRGYRLLSTIKRRETKIISSSRSNSSSWTTLFTMPALSTGTAASTICLCLLIAGWVSLKDTKFSNHGFDSVSSPALLSDELLDKKPDYLGGKLQLSANHSNSSVVGSIATPVVSLDEKQYAFIRHDASGSRIFLGRLGSAVEPISVYYSSQHVFNLAWSPLGNKLLFAMRSSVATEAMYSTTGETAELLSLNLSTLETSRLVEGINPANTTSPKDLNLT
mgnify:CR=1 FL=1|tara:strand:- start:23060 stop:24079 length:1020 start_codon:yes stop_codon:yes gene_type:complete